MVSVWVTGCAAGVGVDAGVAVGPLGTVWESGPQARVNSNGITGGAVPNQVLQVKDDGTAHGAHPFRAGITTELAMSL